MRSKVVVTHAVPPAPEPAPAPKPSGRKTQPESVPADAEKE